MRATPSCRREYIFRAQVERSIYALGCHTCIDRHSSRECTAIPAAAARADAAFTICGSEKTANADTSLIHRIETNETDETNKLT